MKPPSKDIRWLLDLGAAVTVIALSFLTLTGIVAVYAFSLAFRARGSPDQAAISQFAASVSRWLMPWLQCSFALIAAILVARRTGATAVLNGVLTGTAAGLLGMAVAFAFGGRVSLQGVAWVLATAGLGWLGAIIGRRRDRLPDDHAPH